MLEFCVCVCLLKYLGNIFFAVLFCQQNYKNTLINSTTIEEMSIPYSLAFIPVKNANKYGLALIKVYRFW